MTLDLTRPEHRDCLGYACLNRLSPGYDHDDIMREAYLTRFRSRPDDAETRFALVLEFERAISSPSDSAVIVRALLDGCGVVCDGEWLARANADAWVWIATSGTGVWIGTAESGRHVSETEIPVLILALVACTTPAEALQVAGSGSHAEDKR
jgi:hypothetical protein